MEPNVCGNCELYERGNAWSGTCAKGKHQTSPGVLCTIDAFVLAASLSEDAPAGAFPLAKWKGDGGVWISGKPQPMPPVEVMATAGAWSMVRRAPEDPPINAQGGIAWEQMNLYNRVHTPFVVRTIDLSPVDQTGLKA